MKKYALHFKEVFASLNWNGWGPGLLPPQATWGVTNLGYINMRFLTRAY